MGQRSLASSGTVCRRDGIPARDGLEVKRSWSRDVHAEYRLCSTGVPQHGSLDLLRAWKLESESADLRRVARRPRVRPEWSGQLERRFLASGAPGNAGPPWLPEPDLRPVPPSRCPIDARGSE